MQPTYRCREIHFDVFDGSVDNAFRKNLLEENMENILREAFETHTSWKYGQGREVAISHGSVSLCFNCGEISLDTQIVFQVFAIDKEFCENLPYIVEGCRAISQAIFLFTSINCSQTHPPTWSIVTTESYD